MWSGNHTHARTHRLPFLSVFVAFFVCYTRKHTKYFLSSMPHTSCISPNHGTGACPANWMVQRQHGLPSGLGGIYVFQLQINDTPGLQNGWNHYQKSDLDDQTWARLSHARGGRLITTWLVMKKRALLCLEGLSSGTNERVPNCTIASSTSSKITPVNLLSWMPLFLLYALSISSWWMKEH